MADGPAPVKCLVWDLDNTLWRGTLLEDGEVVLPDEVRAVITALDERGILQSVASRNDHDLAWRQLERLGLAEYFVLPAIGWGAKSESVRAIADGLGFAHTAIAFVDDQPAERAEVAFHLPEVRCYTHDQVPTLPDLPEFTPASVTADSRRRRQMYQANSRRAAARERFSGPDGEFLRSLELVMRIGRADEAELARVEELTLRTSQMNATGVHYPDAVLRDMCDDPAHEVLVVTLADRFGPHGAVGVVLLARHPDVWHLKLLATSCRVVSFGAGAVILNWLVDQAHRAGAHLAADFRPTGRNRMMDVAYRFAGLDDEPCACLAAPAEPAEPDVVRLHVEPGPREAPDYVHLVAEDLSAPRVEQW
ncbi:HAD-IIIC family phosphatase [Saccharothrix xinjiangensis]|uniref:HAD-IIIC family phosphatase n=1 Tax=Saccharothrix xinjiangensis TaxID=204798 RepID=A0ABV9Y2K1_9PSEU